MSDLKRALSEAVAAAFAGLGIPEEFGRVTASDRPDLAAGPVATALAEWPGAADVWAMEIDPDLADTASFNAHFGWADEASGNCVVVSGKRAGDERIAALVVPADRRADVNTVVRKLLDVHKLSFHPHERAVAETGMEYGGIVPFGLLPDWRLLVDARLLDQDWVLVGSGVRSSKLLLPGARLAELPGAEVIHDLSR